MVKPEPLAVLDFWFRELEPRQWFGGAETLDAMMGRRFGPWVEAARRGELDVWSETPRGRLALILLLDQFTRNIYRGTADAFAGDARAQTLVVEGLAAGMDKPLNLAERQFFYMPLMHAEDPALQALSAAKFGAFWAEARSVMRQQRRHASVVARFGRFPTRNAALGRQSTPEEQAFLAKPRRS